MQIVSFNPGDIILAEGEVGDTAFLIRRGEVEVSVGAGAKAKVVTRLGPGEIFGEMSLIEPGPRSATVRALAATDCVLTSYDDLVGSIAQDPESAVIFIKTLVRRLRQTNELLAALDPRKRSLREIIADSFSDQHLTDDEIERKYALTPYLFW
ncbi:MAG: cyclic nucleotide-binding domain-containing protein [Devosia sp.]|nr:cyclic nucleotide-binding domain-containing protein [Devosia sp.]